MAVFDIGQEEHFLKKKDPYSIPFLSFSHQNKALHGFRKRGQRLIVEHNIGLEYTLMIACKIFFILLSLY